MGYKIRRLACWPPLKGQSENAETDADQLKQMNIRGEITDCIVEGRFLTIWP